MYDEGSFSGFWILRFRTRLAFFHHHSILKVAKNVSGCSGFRALITKQGMPSGHGILSVGKLSVASRSSSMMNGVHGCGIGSCCLSIFCGPGKKRRSLVRLQLVLVQGLVFHPLACL